jgi:hypothetical protein
LEFERNLLVFFRTAHEPVQVVFGKATADDAAVLPEFDGLTGRQGTPRQRGGRTNVVPGPRFNIRGSIHDRSQGPPDGGPGDRAHDPGGRAMQEPAKNRLHDYEAGWLTLLVEMRLATKQEAREAMSRVAQRAIDEMNERRERRSGRRRRRKPDGD